MLLDNQHFFAFSASHTKQRQTSEPSTFMSRLFSRLVVVLLTILLGMPFQYGAAADVVRSANESTHLSHTADLSDDSLLFASDIVSIQDRNGSDADDSHTGQSCLMGVCASCLPAVVPDFIPAAKFVFVPFSQNRADQFVDFVASTLFRPPIS